MTLSTFVAVSMWVVSTIAPGGQPIAGDQVDQGIVVPAGRPLHIALDERTRVKRVGQPITGTLVEPVWAYDRIVVPAGTKVRGHLAALEQASKSARVRAMLGGDFAPHRAIVVQFDAFLLGDGREVPVTTIVKSAVVNLRRDVAGEADAPKKTGVAQKVKDKAAEEIAAAKQRAKDAFLAVTQPGKWERLKDAVIQRLPYHPQFLARGTVYDAELTSPLTFAHASPIDRAPAGTAPAPLSILNARLVTPLDSATTTRGSPVEAVLTEPVFSSDHQLILPEGTRLTGEVIIAKQARRFHHNGQLRFLLERVAVPEESSSQLLASLYSVQTAAEDNVTLDDEGGAAITNPKTRFIAPALAILALRGSLTNHHELDHDGDANDTGGLTHTVQAGNPGSRGLGGFLGFGLIGTFLGQISRPAGIAFAAVGVARTVYTNVFGKGREVSFPADTPIQLQLAPGAAK